MQQHITEADTGNVQPRQTPPAFLRRARTQVVRQFIAGFIVVLVLLGLDGLVGAFGLGSVRATLDAFTRRQSFNFGLIEDLQRTEASIRAIQFRLPLTSSDRDELKIALDREDRRAHELFTRVSPDDPDIRIWREVETSLFSLTGGLHAALSIPHGQKFDFARLLEEGNRFTLTTQKLIRLSRQRIDTARRSIEDATLRQEIEDRVLLAACVLAASLFLIAGMRIYYRLSEKSEELNIVSWQLLERQELLAQRLSRELHDELGQTLTALKTNFSRHSSAGCADPAWMQDCTELLKGSIRSAHEISQLLRPTLLDDFGLDSALAWLCERFEERNGIQVRYRSNYHWRLEEQAETHVFRIAQEALTNVARHSKANAVDVFFSKQHGVVRLKIVDNGVGLSSPPRDSSSAFGLTGMKARARSLEGELHIESTPGHGVAIDVVFPAKPVS